MTIEQEAEAFLRNTPNNQPPEVYDRIIATSQAISLKRIADALERMNEPIMVKGEVIEPIQYPSESK